jgi:hypothetical protein
LDNRFCEQLRENLRACKWLLILSLSPPPLHFDDTPFASKNGAHGVYCNAYYRFGAVKDVVVKMDPNTQQSRGFGFVMFVNEESIDGVLQGGPHNLDGKRVNIKI